MVGLPAMRRGSFTFVTRPSTVAPVGITVLPPRTTGSVTRPVNGSPPLLENVERVFSSFTLTTVPAGSEGLVSATTMVAANNTESSAANFFILSPKLFLLILNLTVKHCSDQNNVGSD